MSSTIFPLTHIAFTAAITTGVALLLLLGLRTRWIKLQLSDCLLVAIVVGISVLVWRSVGNTGATPQRSHSRGQP